MASATPVRTASANLKALESRLLALETERNAQAALSLADVIYASEEGVSATHPRAAVIAKSAAKVRAARSDSLAREICRLADETSQVTDSSGNRQNAKKRDPALSNPAAVVRVWRENPVTFARQVLGVVLDDWQAAALMALVKFMRVAQSAGRGPGKTFLEVVATLWFMTTRPFAKAVAVSMSADNLKRGFIAEMAAMLRRAATRSKLFAGFELTGDGLALRSSRLDWFCAFRSWSRDADANTQAAALGGVHGDHMLFVMDEAGGVAPEVLQVAEAVAANADPAQGREAKLLLAGNPLSRTSALYRAVITDRARWEVFEISSAPNDPLRAPRVDPAWAQAQIDAYGLESAFVQISIFGRFPNTAINALLSEAEVIEAQRRDLPVSGYDFAARILGLDPARFGADASVLTLRQGSKVLLMQTYRNLDNMTLASIVADIILREKPDATFIDAGGGSGVIDRLRQLNFGDIREVPFAGKPSSGRYVNKRAEMYARVAEWVKAGGCLPKQPELVADLAEPQFTFKGDAMQIESKEDIRSRIGRSPDWGDSLALTFADPYVTAMWHPSMGLQALEYATGTAHHLGGSAYDPLTRGLGNPHSMDEKAYGARRYRN
jgi:hypothetical protein